MVPRRARTVLSEAMFSLKENGKRYAAAYASALVSVHTIGRERLQVGTSRRGEAPNVRVYSRLNWETLA